MLQQDLVFPFKARYYQLGELKEDTRAAWFVLHGYGQLAGYFIRKFKVLEKHHICVIAPEGLSRFYLENFIPGSGRINDRVGATWMTKENRSTDIENYLTYLNTVYRSVIGQKQIPVSILGFSQGSATACRWAMSKEITYERLLLWSGMFPPDMDFEAGKDVLKEKEVILVYGKKDPFLSDELFHQMKILTSKLDKNITEIGFDGEHDIDERVLENLVKK